MDIRATIIAANKAYRDGHPTMDDQTFDNLCEQFQQSVPEEEYAAFRNSLNEGKGKVKHPYVMGSLDKLKAECREDVLGFIEKNIKKDGQLNISAKVDGISCRLHYGKDGALKSASTRGDGYFGEDLTDKIAFVKNVKHQLVGMQHEIDIRGELVILKKDFEKIASRFANPRNATAGIMNRKDWTSDDVSIVTFVPYTVLGDACTKHEQFEVLEKLGFKTAWWIDIPKTDIDNSIVDRLLEYLEQDFEYEVDGLVLSDASYLNEDKYRPDKQVAFKANQLTTSTTVIDIVFEGPSKDGYFIPVAVLDPVELGGSVISRATCHNLDYIEDKGIKYGSVVELLKSGDIIPKIIRVIDNSKSSSIAFPEECPCCGARLVRDGLNLRCTNKQCRAQTTQQVVMFIKKLGCKHASNATLKNLGISSIEDLVNFVPNKKYKTETKLYDELYTKVFSQSREEILKAMNFVGLSQASIDKILQHYGYSSVESISFKDDACKSMPNGIGHAMLDSFIEGLHDAISKVNLIVNDQRWHWTPIEAKSSTQNATKGSICVTGPLKSGSRSRFLEFAKEHGYESKSGVSKGLTYLVNNDINSQSSKNVKAKQLGIQIISEDDFIKIAQGSSIECSIDCL